MPIKIDINALLPNLYRIPLVYLLATAPLISQAAVEPISNKMATSPSTADFSKTEEVDPQNGTLTVQNIDLEIPGPPGMNIIVARNYSSSTISAGLASTYRQSYKWISLGPGWTINAAPKIVHSLWSYPFNRQVMYIDSPVTQLCAGQVLPTYPVTAIYLALPDGTMQMVYAKEPHIGITKSNWKIECRNSLVTAKSPDGITYEFGNWESDRVVGFESTEGWRQTSMLGGVDVSGQSSVTYLNAKKSIDPYGNWIKYNYLRLGRVEAPWPLPGKRIQVNVNRLSDAAYEGDIVISKISSSDGRTVDFLYDPVSSRLKEVKDGTGRSVKYTYQPATSNQSLTLSTVILPSGDTWQYQYAPGAFMWANNPNWTILPLTPEVISRRKLIGIKYPTGGISTYTYAAIDITRSVFTGTSTAGDSIPVNIRLERVSSHSLSNGATWTYEYFRGVNNSVDKTIVTGPDGATTHTFLSAERGIRNDVRNGQFPGSFQNTAWDTGRPSQVTNPDGSTTNYTWQKREISPQWTYLVDGGLAFDQKAWSADLEKRIITRDGATYETSYSNYDEYGNPRTKVEKGPNGGLLTTFYTYYNNPEKWIIGKIKSENSESGSLLREYNQNGSITSETRDGVTTLFTYDNGGNLASKITAGGGTYTYSDYKFGTAQHEKHPEGITISRTVDDAGNVISETDGEGKTASYIYDTANRLISATPPQGNTTAINYTSNSRTVTRGDLVETTNYDQFGQTIKIERAGISKSFAYDALGRKIFESNPNSEIGTNYDYDTYNRIIRLTNPDNSYQVHSYGPGSQKITDERNNQTTYNYRSYGDPDKKFLVSIITPKDLANTLIERNAKGLIRSVTQGGVTRTYDYDSHYYLTRITEPETGEARFDRDIEGNLIRRTVGNSPATTFSYNKLNQLIETSYPSQSSIYYTYDRRGKMLSAKTTSNERIFNYDDNGNLTSESLSLDGITLSASYMYDENDRLRAMKYPISEKIVSYSPDTLGRATKATGYVSSASYWPSGQVKDIAYSNDITSSYGQNIRTWPRNFKTLKSGVATPYINSSYSYDLSGNLTAIIDDTDLTYNRELRYDEIHRLTGAKGPWGLGSISYKDSGDIANQTFGNAILNYIYDDNNRLNGLTGNRATTYSYDTYGNITSGLGNTYIYDDVPNLRCINCGSTTSETEYTYDAINMRSSVIQNGIKTIEMYDNSGKLLISYTPNQSKLVEYIYLGDRRIAQITNQNEINYFHNDISGSAILATGSGGEVLWKENYRPFGAKLNQESASNENKIGFHGKPFDNTSGLSYMGARYYDPLIGRFTGIDPIHFKETNLHSFNRYAYTSNNPYKYTDPDGRQIVSTYKADNTKIESMINSYSSSQFKFDNNNRLQRVEGHNKDGSSYYSKQISQAIKSENTIYIKFDNEVFSPTLETMTPIETSGGAATVGFADGSTQLVVIGDEGKMTFPQAMGGGYANSTQASALVHELVGHAIPNAIGSDTGNAILNENKVWSQIKGAPLRALEPTHKERGSY